MSNTATQVVVRHHALDQCEVLVSGKRVAYVRYGTPAPLNWLPPQTIKLQLSVAEREAIAREARAQMEALNAERDGQAARLAALTAGPAPASPELAAEVAEVAEPAAATDAESPAEPAAD